MSDPKMYPLAEHYHATVRKLGMGWIAYQVWYESTEYSYPTKVFNTKCKAASVEDAVEHARTELEIWLKRESGK